MIELLSTLSITEILISIVLIAFAAKEFITLKDFFKKRTDDHYAAKDEQESVIENIFQEIQSLKKEIEEHQQDYNQVNDYLKRMSSVWTAKEEEHRQTLKLLVQSDMDATKSFIVKEHHHYCKQGWIDDFSLDTIEKRYNHYLEEGGNSYVSDLIQDLRNLPNYPPSK